MLSPHSMFGHFLLAAACALGGALAPFACSQAQDIHDTPDAKGQPCVNCHLSAYATTLNPKHVGTLPNTCDVCHNTRVWLPATVVDHHWFVLDNAHTTVPCAKCHTTGYNAGDTPTDCVGCHLADYQKSPFPGHNTFPKTCMDCHSTAAWKPATGGTHPEAKFPITTGSHANKAVACTDCHIASLGSPVLGANTDCSHCHIGAHMEPTIDADPAHKALGAAYPGPDAGAPNFCLHCHPTG